MSFDKNVLVWVSQNLSHSALAPYMIFITIYGIYIIGFLGILLSFFKPTRLFGLTLILSFILSLIGTNLIKLFVERSRPFEEIGFTPLIKVPFGTSFPSTHSALAFSFLGSFYLSVDWKAHPVMITLVTLISTCIAVSRIYVLVHYPTDVLAGIVCGLVSAYISYSIIRHFVRGKRSHQFSRFD